MLHGQAPVALEWKFLVFSSSCSLLSKALSLRKCLCTLRTPAVLYVSPGPGQLGERPAVLVHVC